MPRFASEVWQGYIFVNLDGLAPPLAPALVAHRALHPQLSPGGAAFPVRGRGGVEHELEMPGREFHGGLSLEPAAREDAAPGHADERSARNCPTARLHRLPRNFHPECPERGPFHPDLTRAGAALGRLLLRLSEFRGRLLSALHPVHVRTPAHGRHASRSAGASPGSRMIRKSPVGSGLPAVLQGILRGRPRCSSSACREGSRAAPTFPVRSPPIISKEPSGTSGNTWCAGSAPEPPTDGISGHERSRRTCSCAMPGMWRPSMPSSRTSSCRSRSSMSDWSLYRQANGEPGRAGGRLRASQAAAVDGTHQRRSMSNADITA